MPLTSVVADVRKLLDTIQTEMFTRAKERYDASVKIVTDWKDFVPTLDAKCVVIMPWCEQTACEDDIKERSGRVLVALPLLRAPFKCIDGGFSAVGEQTDERAPSAGAKSLAFPLDQAKYPAIEHGKTKCPACDADAKRWMLFGRSY